MYFKLFMFIIILLSYLNLYAQEKINNEISKYLQDTWINDFYISGNDIWFSLISKKADVIKYDGKSIDRYCFPVESSGKMSDYKKYDGTCENQYFLNFVHSDFANDNTVILYNDILQFMFIKNDCIYYKDYSEINYRSEWEIFRDEYGLLYALTGFKQNSNEKLLGKIYLLKDSVEELFIPFSKIPMKNVSSVRIISFFKNQDYNYYLFSSVSNYDEKYKYSLIIQKEDFYKYIELSEFTKMLRYKYCKDNDFIYIISNEGDIFQLRDFEIINSNKIYIPSNNDCFWVTINSNKIYLSNSVGLYVYSLLNYELLWKYSEIFGTIKNISIYSNKLYGNLGTTSKYDCGGLSPGIVIINLNK